MAELLTISLLIPYLGLGYIFKKLREGCRQRNMMISYWFFKIVGFPFSIFDNVIEID
jgi:hypothetical protein